MFTILLILKKLKRCLFVLGLHHQSVDDLMQSKVEACDGGFVCMLCGKFNKRRDHMRRHIREIHLSLDGVYQCPSCGKYFKNRTAIYSHVHKLHKEWKGVNYDNLFVRC